MLWVTQVTKRLKSKCRECYMAAEDIRCNICGHEVDVLYDFGSYEWFKCSSCHFCFSTTMMELTAEERARYNEKYFAENPNFFRRVTGEDKIKIRVWGKYLDLLQQFNIASSQRRLLDIGCSLGGFLNIARNKGWEVHGVEVSDFVARYARDELKLDVFTGTLEEAKFPPASFDVVTMWDIIEHLNPPSDTIAEICRITKPEGLILIYTPNQDSLINAWIYLTYKLSLGKIRFLAQKIYLPYIHLCYFSPKSLTYLLQLHGYEVEHMANVSLQAYTALTSSKIERIGATVIDFIGKVFNKPYRMVIIGRKVR